MVKKNQSFYVHIPFCERKCAYCNFTSIANHSELHFSYFKALKKEIKSFLSAYKKNTKVKNVGDISETSIYFGGGTPSSVNADYLIEVLDLFKEEWESAKVRKCESEKGFQPEITVECNPTDRPPRCLSIEFAEKLINAGVTRFSLGVQSLNNFELKKLGRLHDADRARKAFKILREAGCKNISVDLMFGIPGQTKESWQATLLEISKEWHPEHISFYSLSIEPGTPFYKWKKTKTWNWPDDDKTMDWYWLGNKILSEAGYNRYEISNFSLPDFESNHNSKYWDFKKSYIGFGAAAHSFCDLPGEKKRRFRNIKSVKEYIKRIESGTKFRVFSRELDSREKAGEEIFLGLRLSEGIKLNKTHLTFFEEVIKQQVDDGLIKYVNEEKIALTDRGIEIANVVMSEYV